MTHPGDTFEPNPIVHEVYDELYQHIYCQMYSHLKPLYEQLRSIQARFPKDSAPSR
jgi:sugar (pentulose or hexulose) kinase